MSADVGSPGNVHAIDRFEICRRIPVAAGVGEHEDAGAVRCLDGTGNERAMTCQRRLLITCHGPQRERSPPPWMSQLPEVAGRRNQPGQGRRGRSRTSRRRSRSHSSARRPRSCVRDAVDVSVRASPPSRRAVSQASTVPKRSRSWADAVRTCLVALEQPGELARGVVGIERQARAVPDRAFQSRGTKTLDDRERAPATPADRRSEGPASLPRPRRRPSRPGWRARPQRPAAGRRPPPGRAPRTTPRSRRSPLGPARPNPAQDGPFRAGCWSSRPAGGFGRRRSLASTSCPGRSRAEGPRSTATSLPALGELAIDIGQEDRDLASQRFAQDGRPERGEPARHLEIDRIAHLRRSRGGSGRRPRLDDLRSGRTAQTR